MKSDAREEQTAQLIFDSFLDNSWDKVGFFQLANRLMLGMSKKMILAIYIVFEDKPNYAFLATHTLNDPFFTPDRLEIQTDDRVPSEDKQHPFKLRAYKLRKFKKHCVKISSNKDKTKHYLLRFIPLKSDLSETPPKIVFSSPTQKDYERASNIMNRVSEKFEKYFGYDFFFVCDEIFSAAIQGVNPRIKNEFIAPPNPIGSFDQDCNAIRTTIEELYDREYRKIFESPILTPYEEFPPRVLFHIKAFDREKARLNVPKNRQYHFNSYLLMGQVQKEHIRRGFLHLLTEGKLSDEFVALSITTKYRFPEKNVEIEIPRYRDKKVDQAFWQILKSDPEHILEILSSPPKDNERIFIDGCLTSGVVQFRSDVLFQSKDWSTEQVRSYINYYGDELRLVCHHYLFCMLSDRPECSYQNLISVPTRVAGAPLGAISTVYGSMNDDLSSDDEGVYNRNRAFYEKIAMKINSNVRHSLRRYFVNSIYTFYMDAICRAQGILLPNAVASGAFKSPQEEMRKVERRIRILQRFLPFDASGLMLVDQGAGAELIDFQLSKKQKRRVQYSKDVLTYGLENPYFSRFGKGRIGSISCIEILNSVIHNLPEKLNSMSA